MDFDGLIGEAGDGCEDFIRGSFESTKVWLRWGLRPKARQMRLMLVWLQAEFSGHLTRAPVRGSLGCALQGFGHDLFDLIVPDFPRSAHAGFIEKPVEAARQKAFAPDADRVVGRPQFTGDLRIVPPAVAAQEDLRPKSDAAPPALLPRESL